MLLFKKKFLEAIRSGEKTQTVRLWKYAKMRAGQRSYVPGVGYIRIEAVDPVELAELTDDDARPDGFETADALRAEIESLYAKYRSHDQRAFRIKFSRLSADEKPRPKPVRPAAIERAKPERRSAETDSAIVPQRIPLPANGYPLAHNRSH